MVKAQKYLSAHPEIITKSFKVTGISLALDGSEDHLFRNDILQQADQPEDKEEDDDPFSSEYDSEGDSEDEDRLSAS